MGSALPASHPSTSQAALQDRGGSRTQLCKHLSCFDPGTIRGWGRPDAPQSRPLSALIEDSETADRIPPITFLRKQKM